MWPRIGGLLSRSMRSSEDKLLNAVKLRNLGFRLNTCAKCDTPIDRKQTGRLKGELIDPELITVANYNTAAVAAFQRPPKKFVFLSRFKYTSVLQCH